MRFGTSASRVQVGVVDEVDRRHLQVRFAGAGLGRDDPRLGHVQHHPVDVGQLHPVLVDAVEVGVAHEHELVGRRRRGVAPGVERRQVRVLGAVAARHPRMQVRPVVHLVMGHERVQQFRILVLRMELPHVVRRQHDRQRLRRGKPWKEARVRRLPGVADGEGVEDLEDRALVRRQKLGRKAARPEVGIHHVVFPAVAEILGRNRCAVRPAVPFTQAEGEDAVLVDREALQDVGVKLKVRVVGHETAVAVHRHEADVALAADDGADLAALPAGLAPHRGKVHNARNLRQPVQRVFGHRLGMGGRKRVLPLGGAQRPRTQGSRHYSEKAATIDHVPHHSTEGRIESAAAIAFLPPPGRQSGPAGAGRRVQPPPRGRA